MKVRDFWQRHLKMSRLKHPVKVRIHAKIRSTGIDRDTTADRRNYSSSINNKTGTNEP